MEVGTENQKIDFARKILFRTLNGGYTTAIFVCGETKSYFKLRSTFPIAEEMVGWLPEGLP